MSSSNQKGISVEDEFVKKDSFRFPNGNKYINSNRNMSQARVSSHHRKSRTKTEQQVAATGRINYPSVANAKNGDKKRFSSNHKNENNSNNSSSSNTGKNDQQQSFNYPGIAKHNKNVKASSNNNSDKDNFKFKKQNSTSNHKGVSVEDEFARKDSFRFPSGDRNNNRNMTQARFSNSHRKSRRKTEQVSVQVSATGRMNYPTMANPNGDKRRLNSNHKNERHSNTSSSSSIGNNDQQQSFDYGVNSNNNSRSGNHYHNHGDKNFSSNNMHSNNNNNNNSNSATRPHKNQGYAKEKSRRRRRHSSNGEKPRNNNNSMGGNALSATRHGSMDSMHDSRMKAIFMNKNQNNNYKTPRKDTEYINDSYSMNSKINTISPSSAERIINEHGRIRITNTPSPPPSANPNSDRKRPSRRPGSNLININSNNNQQSSSKTTINLPDNMKNITVETRRGEHGDNFYSNSNISLVSIHKGSNGSASNRQRYGNISESISNKNKGKQVSGNKFTSRSPPIIDKNTEPRVYGLTYKERHSPTKINEVKQKGNASIQNSHLSNVKNSDDSRKKTFSPSAPNRPRGTKNGERGHKSRPRKRRNKQRQTMATEHSNGAAADEDDVVVQPRENPNLRLQSIDDVQTNGMHGGGGGSSSSKHPNGIKSPKQNIKNSHVKNSIAPPGAAIFQFPLWNNSKKINDTPNLTTLSTNKATKLDGLRQGSSTNANNASNIMSPPSLVKLHVESSDDSDNLAEWKNPSPPDSKKQVPSKRTSFFSSFFKKSDKDADSPSTKKEIKRPSSSNAATSLIDINEKGMSKNALLPKNIKRNIKSKNDGNRVLISRLQKNENSRSAPGLQDSLTSTEGLESYDFNNNNNNIKKDNVKKNATPVVSGDVIHEFGLWKNVKKNIKKADEALDLFKNNTGSDNQGVASNNIDAKKKSSPAIVEKKLPTPPKKPSSSGKRFRGRNGRSSPSTSPIEKTGSQNKSGYVTANSNNISNSNISAGQLSIDIGMHTDDGDESSIMENINISTTDSSALSAMKFSQSPRIAKTGAVLFRQSLSPTPFQWKKGEKIGHGTYGDVFMALNQVTGELFCVKQIRVQPGVLGGEKEAFARIKALEREISVMKNLEHPHIVRYLGTESKDADSNNGDLNQGLLSRRVFVFLEYVPGGSLSKMLKQFGAFGEPVVQRYTFQILRGLNYLHSKGFIHRDIKGANVLVSEAGVAKLADFGCSKQLQGTATGSMDESLRSIRGSIPWMAPEVIRQSGHGRSADIWSLGATVIEMLTATRPWPNLDDSFSALFHVASTKTGPPYPGHISDLCKDFLDCCFPIEPKERLTASQLLEHEFLGSVAKKSSRSDKYAEKRFRHLGEGVARSTDF